LRRRRTRRAGVGFPARAGQPARLLSPRRPAGVARRRDEPGARRRHPAGDARARVGAEPLLRRRPASRHGDVARRATRGEQRQRASEERLLTGAASIAAPVDARPSFAELREREFSRLDAQRCTYVDYTGSAVYGESQLRAHHDLLRGSLFGNPHSEHTPSRASAALIEEARATLLRFLGVDASTHAVCFTANTTAAIKLVAESYPFAPDTALLLSADNHNSVNGMREYARRADAPVRYLALDGELRLRDADAVLAEEACRGRGLLAFPAQSNFSGVRHPLALVGRAKALGFDVLLDAAAYVPSHALSLRDCPADYVALSFYKLFGYPTGLGALVATRDALDRLRRPWFAGGTVAYASVHADTHRLRIGPEGFEDGTQNFLGIAALAAGFALLDEIGMPRLTAHVQQLTEHFLGRLTKLRHGNGVRRGM